MSNTSDFWTCSHAFNHPFFGIRRGLLVEQEGRGSPLSRVGTEHVAGALVSISLEHVCKVNAAAECVDVILTTTQQKGKKQCSPQSMTTYNRVTHGKLSTYMPFLSWAKKYQPWKQNLIILNRFWKSTRSVIKKRLGKWLHGRTGHGHICQSRDYLGLAGSHGKLMMDSYHTAEPSRLF